MTARPRRASTAAIVIFPAPDMPLICTAFIGVYRGPALKADANEFMFEGLGAVGRGADVAGGGRFPAHGRYSWVAGSTISMSPVLTS